MSEPGREGQSSFTMSRLNLRNEVLHWIFRWHPGQSDWGVNHLSTFDTELRNVRFLHLISNRVYGVSCNIKSIITAISNLHLLKRKYSKLTFSNGYQLMRKRFMAHLHASLESTCKSRISKISTRFHNQGEVDQSFNFWSWTQKCKFCIDIFYGVSCNIKSIAAISNLHSQEKIE